MTKPTQAQLMRKVERLQRENEELRDKIAHHMRVYGELLAELVTYQIRIEQAQKVLEGSEE